jgi:hypothetical protein
VKELPRPLDRAYSHNDYRQSKPLSTALENGFLSAEVDIFDRKGTLPIGHMSPGKMKLDSCYLEQLAKLAKENDNGRIYPNSDLPFILMIDMKSPSDQVHKDLHETLKKYDWMLTKCKDGVIHNGAVTVVISGHQPSKKFIANLGKERFEFYDGREKDLENLIDPSLKTVISMRWSKKRENKLCNLVTKAHNNHQRIRFWGIPERENVWEKLYNAGVDFINTDNPARLREFLLAKDHIPVKKLPSLPIDTISKKTAIAAIPTFN